MRSHEGLTPSDLIRIGGLLAGTALAWACGDPSGPGTPTLLEVVAGDGGSASIATALPDSLVVRVVDDQERPVPGVEVAWQVGSGGGALSPAVDTTGASGEVRTQWVLGPTVGAQAASASVRGLARATFTATATAVTLMVVGGDGQSVTAGTAAPESLVVRAADR
jgi:hypothetical protein